MKLSRFRLAVRLRSTSRCLAASASRCLRSALLTAQLATANDKNGRIKLELALGKGKRQYDKRAAIADRESKRELERVMKESFAR